jgi:hypothetical protein
MQCLPVRRELLLLVVSLSLSACCLQAQVCGNSVSGALCIEGPSAGDTAVTGRLLQGSDPTKANMVLIINDNAGPHVAAKNDGTFQSDALKTALKACDVIEVVQSHRANNTTVLDGKASATIEGNCESPSLFTLGLAGINATGSSSSGPSQQYFAEFNLLSPIPGCPGGDKAGYSLQRRCWVWIDPRIASVPSQNSATISSLTSTSALTSGIGSQSLSQITQSFEFQGGFEWYPMRPWRGAQFGWNQSWSRTSVSLVVGGGSVTPFSGATGASEFGLNPNLAQQFVNSPILAAQYPQLAFALQCAYPASGTPPAGCPKTTPTTVAFVFPNRSRFYRDFFAGLRLRTFYFHGDCLDNGPTCKISSTFPGTFDLRFGEDESVTAGKFLPFVVTITGSYPLPIPGSSGSIRIFGSAYLRTASNRNTQALALVPAASFTSIDNPTVVIQSIQPIDTDYYRLGFGVDLVALLSKLGGSK